MSKLNKEYLKGSKEFSRKFEDIMDIRNRLLRLDAEIGGIKMFLKKVRLSKWRDKKEIIKERKEYLASLEEERRELQKRYDAHMARFSKKERLEERRYNEKNISST